MIHICILIIVCLYDLASITSRHLIFPIGYIDVILCLRYTATSKLYSSLVIPYDSVVHIQVLPGK